jgi:iron complex transport system permease protein
LGGLVLLTLLAILLGLGSGPVALSPREVVLALIAGEDPALAGDRFIVWELRLPRVLGALLVGAVLAQCGAAMQGLFRNPLADPGLIGISAGAAVGAISSLLFLPAWLPTGHPLGVLQLPLAGLLGGWVTALLVYKTGSLGGRVSVTAMLLAGIAINAFAGALTGLFIFLADDQQLRSINFWMLGSLGHISWQSLLYFTPLLLIALIGLASYARPLDAMLLGEAEAYHLGFDVTRIKRGIIFFIAAGVGAAVALTGVIGFIGLVVPHLLRLVLGPGHRCLLPAAVLLGAALLILADAAARVIAAPAEMPIGILTALLGTPFFFALILRSRHFNA